MVPAAPIIEHQGSGGASTLFGAVADFIYKIENMPQSVGIVWLVSSAIYTTYATKAFLDYRQEQQQQQERLLPLPPPLSPSMMSMMRRTTMSPLQTDSSAVHLARARQWRFPTPTVPAHKWSVTRPTLLTLVRFGGSLLLGLVVHTDVWRIWERIVQTAKAAPAFWFPAACLFTANFSNAISLNRIGISLTYTSKCAIPLITVLLALMVEGADALPNGLALLSLVPIALGIGAASWNSPTFEKTGFIAAMLSATAQSALNVSSKRAMAKTGIRGASTQRVMVAIGFVIAIVVSGIEHQFSREHFDDAKKQDNNDNTGGKEATTAVTATAIVVGEPLALYLAAITAYHIEYVLSFMFVKLVSPVTYGACDAVRRLCIILAGRAMFGGKPLTIVNKSGIALALIGALGYSIASSASPVKQ